MTNIEIDKLMKFHIHKPENDIEIKIYKNISEIVYGILKKRLTKYKRKRMKIHINLVTSFPISIINNENEYTFAYSTISRNLHFYIFFNIIEYMNYFKSSQEDNTKIIHFWNLIYQTSLHESFHLIQMDYIFRHYGYDYLQDLLEYYNSLSYEENPFEKGACQFEHDPKNYYQSFKNDLILI